MRIGMLTGGGDCPGLNAVIRAVVRKGVGEYGHSIIGYRHGWRGLIAGRVDRPLAPVRAGAPPAWRHDPRNLAHEPVQVGRRADAGARDAGAATASTRSS